MTPPLSLTLSQLQAQIFPELLKTQDYIVAVLNTPSALAVTLLGVAALIGFRISGRATSTITFDIRERILANAKILWPILVDEKVATPAIKACFAPGKLPDFEIIITSRSKGFVARVVHGPAMSLTQAAFLGGRSADTVEGALQKLLNVTMTGLGRHYAHQGSW